MRPSPGWIGSLLFLVPLLLGLRELPAVWKGLGASAAALAAPSLADLPDVPEKDYRFLRAVASHLRPGDRLVLFKDGKLRDLAVPLLSGGWFGHTDVVFDPDEAITRAELVAQNLPAAEIEAAMRFLATLRRSPEECARLVAEASVVVAMRSRWSTTAGTLLVDAGPACRAWRVR